MAAAHLWDSTVHEAINLLELEESMYVTSVLSFIRKLTTLISAPSSPPSSPLRAALHSALLSTQTQSDNVRHVLVGLTSPSSLAQLSEMYAPPSPIKPHAPHHTRSGSATPASRISTTPSTPSEKRATWNGSIPWSYAALAEAGSPSRQSLKRWEKRRSDVSALLLQPTGVVMSAPVTPQAGRSLEGVEEETLDPLDLPPPPAQEADADVAVPPEERGQFASAALELQRQRRSRGVETFVSSTRSPPSKYTPISTQLPFSTHIVRLGSKPSHSNPTSPRSSYSASRFTAMQIPRHPLSLHSLTLALNGALAARRYAASHLLALRFGGGDSMNDSERASESYWEDVRAVMALLTTALANATAPLIEALDAAERERIRTENPTPSASHSRSSSSSEPSAQASPLHQQQERRQRRRRQTHRSSHFASFAPLPSHLTRFATHVEVLTNALNDAREHLESCVASLRDRDPSAAITSPLHRGAPQDTGGPALHAYESLRRELGLALRECERGREPLLELLRPLSADEDEEDDEEDEEDRVPALGPDAESSDSDKDAAHARSPSPGPFLALASSARTNAVRQEAEDEEDAAHVLVVGLERLPPPGIEQVFEADVDADDGARHRLARPRSKLSRAERIAAAKARRANPPNTLLGMGLSTAHEVDEDGDGSLTGTGVGGERERRWGGPGGDVVQELKDVIWKVGEQRRLRERRQRREEEDGEDGEPEVEEAEAETEVAEAEAARGRQVDEKQQQVGAQAQVNAAMVAANAATVATREDVFTSPSPSSSSPPPPPPS